jgi:SNF2 family DNA or RNA helicase
MRARKCGFAFDAANAAWRMPPSAVSASRFLREELPAWGKLWRVSGAEALRPLVRELPPLELEAVAGDARNAGAPGLPSFRLRWRLKLGTDWLPDAVARRLFASPGGVVFVPGRGLARLGAGQRAALREWGGFVGGAGGGSGAHTGFVANRVNSGNHAADSADADATGFPDVSQPLYALPALFADDRLRVSADASLSAWHAALLREPEVPPPGLPEFLRPYQARGVAWLARMFALGVNPLLADEMGLGKTVQALALLHLGGVGGSVSSGDADGTGVGGVGVPASSAIVVCPASVTPVWQAEAARFFPAMSVRVLGRGSDWKRHPAPALWLASYALLRGRRALLAGMEFSHAILDEAQFVKNPDAKTSQAVLAIRARRRLAITGTPLENHPGDVWSIFNFLMPGLLGGRAAFEARLEGEADAVPRVARRVAPFILRRGKQAVAPELPPKVVVALPCPLTAAQRGIYDQLAAEGLAALGAEAEPAAGSLLALLTRLRQAACDPGLLPGREGTPVDESGKIAVLAARLGEIFANGRRVVVFSQFVKLLDRVEAVLRRDFPGTPVFRLTGATADRARPVAEFQGLNGAGVMLASLRAGGTGVTLHGAGYVFLLDPWWNPAVEAQAADRVHRIGQRNTTFVYRMIAQGTIESRVEALKEAKAELFEQIVGGLADMSDWHAQLPTLRALLEGG